MMNWRLQPVPITGYYQYLSQVRQRVNVAPQEQRTEGAMPASVDDQQAAPKDLDGTDVTGWSLTDVERWIQQQCDKFELKRTTGQHFQMNGINVSHACVERTLTPPFSPRPGSRTVDQTRFPTTFTRRRRDTLLCLSTVDQQAE